MLYVAKFLLIGCALRYLLPYVLGGLALIGKKEPWPAWEWKYMSALIIAAIGYGVSMATSEGFFQRLAEMTPVALINLAFTSNYLLSWAVKYIKRFWPD